MSSSQNTPPNTPPSAAPIIPNAPVIKKGRPASILNSLFDLLEDQWTIRISYSVLFWIIAAFCASLIDGKQISVPALEHVLFNFITEQVELPLLVFELLVLAITALPSLVVVKWQNEVKSEALRLYYTIGAAAGAILLIGGDYKKAVFFYILAVLVPWILAVSLMPSKIP